MGRIYRELAPSEDRVPSPGFVKKEIVCRSRVRSYLACRLRYLRRSRKFPLKRVAVDLDVSLSSLSAWEKGTRFPSPENLDLLASYYGCLPCQLLAAPALECPVPWAFANRCGGECLRGARCAAMCSSPDV